jgi:FkbM family methyltransferase
VAATLSSGTDPVITACNLLASRAPAGSVAVDVGANVGNVTVALARNCPPLGLVLAVEPNPPVLRQLRLATWRLPVEIHGVALARHAGSAVLSIPADETGRAAAPLATLRTVGQPTTSQESRGRLKTVEVQVRTLDEIVAGRAVALVKVDVEGYESEVLAGAAATIERWHPPLLLEIEARHLGGPEAAMRTLAEVVGLGYHGYALGRNQLLPLAEFDIAAHQLQALDGSGEVVGPKYLNNFLFLPTGYPVEAVATALGARS